MRTTIALLALALVSACGRGEPETPPPPPETPFGSRAQVTEYLDQIAPYIQEVGRLQATVEHSLGARRPDGGPRKGTGRNLAAAAANVRTRMQSIAAEFDQIEPPPLLAPFHRDVRKLMLVRLGAYRLLMDGWEAEESGGDYETLYANAEAKLREANELIRRLNGQMAQVHEALRDEPSQVETADGR